MYFTILGGLWWSFVIHSVKDNEAQYKEAKKLFLAASKGEISLLTSTVVFFEVYWVLMSFYQRDHSDTAATLNDLLKMSFIHIPERTVIVGALNLFERGMGLEDAYNLIFAQLAGAQEFRTFDKKLAARFRNF